MDQDWAQSPALDYVRSWRKDWNWNYFRDRICAEDVRYDNTLNQRQESDQRKKHRTKSRDHMDLTEDRIRKWE